MFAKLGNNKLGKKSLRDQVDDLSDKIAPHVENARAQIGPALADAREKAGPALADARVKAAPYVSDARDYMSDARDKAAPYVSDARERFVKDVVPAVSAAVAVAGEKSGPAREEARRRGLAAAAALKGEVEPPRKRSKFKTLLVLGGLAGVGALVFNKLKGKDEPTSWQSSYSPPAPASPAPAPRAVPTQDAGAASPDEAAADATTETGAHRVTTPDQPLDVVELGDEPKHA